MKEKTGNYKDYFMKTYKDYTCYLSYKPSTANILEPIIEALADDITILEVDRKAFMAIVSYFSPRTDWVDRKIWGIKIKIKK